MGIVAPTFKDFVAQKYKICEVDENLTTFVAALQCEYDINNCFHKQLDL